MSTTTNSNDIHDMEVRIRDLGDDLEHEKDTAKFWEASYNEAVRDYMDTIHELVDMRERISRAIDAIPLNDKTAEGLRLLRHARVRSEYREKLTVEVS